jgi:integrase
LRGGEQAKFNRALPVLAAMLKYAEALGYLRKGSNPCRGTPRFKRKAMERFLSPPEYRRLGLALTKPKKPIPRRSRPSACCFTPARGRRKSAACNGIGCRRRVLLPDSKTGPKTIWLCSQAVQILESLPRREGCPFVFQPEGRCTAQAGRLVVQIPPPLRAADLRIHDLRHSYASIAIRHNMPLATIGKLLGHELPETTAKYAHLADETIADAAARVSGGLASAIGLGA